MSFQINKDSKGKIIKKNIQINYRNVASIINSNTSLALVNDNVYNTSVNNLTNNGQDVPVSENNINYLKLITPGTALGNKAIILNSFKNIENLNNVNCTKFNIDGNELKTTVSTSVASNEFLSNITPGVVSSKSALIVDSLKNINNLNSIKSNSIDTKSFSISSYTNNNLLFSNNGYLSDNNWKDFCWSQDSKNLVAVGNLCIGYSSNSGNTWNYISSLYNLKKIIWVDFIGKYIAIGDNTIVISEDAITWENKLVTGNFNSITYKNGLIIAIGDNCCFYSTNGTTWVSSTVSSYNWTDICYGNNTFITCSNGYISKTVDGITWTDIALVGSWISVCYGGQGFLVASSTTEVTNKVYVSLNGNIWNSMNSNYLFTFDSAITKIYYMRAIKKYFILCKNVNINTPCIYISNDTYSWNSLKLTNNNIILSIAWSNYYGSLYMLGSPYYESEMINNNLYTFEKTSNIVTAEGFTGTITPFKKFIENNNIIHVLSSTAIMYSTDGYEFKNCKINGLPLCTPRNFYDITYSPTLNVYVAVCFYTTTYTKAILYSLDGINWKECDINSAKSHNLVIWNNNLNKFYATTSGDSNLMESNDGITWLLSKNVFYFAWAANISYIPETNRMFILTNNASYSTYTSTDGITWTLLNISIIFRNIEYYNNKYYSANTAGTQIYSSEDGITWVVDTNCAGVSLLIKNTINNTLLAISPSTIYQYNKTEWITISLTNVISPMCSNYYKCIYISSNNANTILRSRSFKSCLLSSYSTDNVDKSYKFLNISEFNEETEDRILTSLSKYTTSTLLDTATSLFYSKKYNTCYVTSSLVSTYSLKYSLDNFVTLVTPTVNTGLVYGVVEHGETIFSYGKTSSIYFNKSTLISAYTKSFTNTTGAASDGNQIILISSNTGNITICSDIFNNKYISNLFDTVSMKCIAYGNSVYAILGNNISYYINNYNKIIIGDFTSGIINSVIFGKDKFVGAGINKIIYSFNGINWLTASTSVYTWNKIIYVNELEIYLACATNTVGYSFDGIIWKFIPTPISNTWVDIIYNSYMSTIHLLGNTSPRLFTTSCIINTLHNVIVPQNSFIKNDKLIINRSSTIVDKNYLTHNIELDGDLRLNNSVFGTDGISSTSGKLNLLTNTSKYINITNHNGTTSGLKINGELLKSSANDLNYINNIIIRNSIQKNAPVILDYSGNINMNTILSYNSLNVANTKLTSIKGISINSPICTTLDNELLGLNKIGTNILTINNSSITNSIQKPSLLDAYSYCDFKPMDCPIDQNAYCMCYSPLLNMIVILYSSTGVTNLNVLYSYNKGQTWNSKYTTIPAITRARNNIIWSSIHNCFIILASYTQIYYSYDGLVWVLSSISALASSGNINIIYDSVNGRIVLCGNLKVYFNDNPNSPKLWTTMSSASLSYVPTSLIYSTFFSKVLTCATGTVSSAPVTTFVFNTFGSYSSTVYDLCSVPTGVLVAFNNIIYKKTTTISNDLGTIKYQGSSSLLIKKLVNFTSSYIIALCNYGYLISSNYGENWKFMQHSYENFGDVFNKTNEGTYSDVIWDGEKLIFKSSYINGVSRLFCSSSFAPNNNMSTEYLINKCKSNLDEESFKSGSLTAGFNLLFSPSLYKIYNTCKGNGYYLYVGSNRILYSANNFKNKSISITLSGEWVGCIYGNMFAICSLDNIAYTSDLSIWTTVSKTGNWKGIAYGNNKYVVCTNGIISYSSDCIAWTDVTVTGNWNNIRFINNMFFIVGKNYISHSLDAITWITVYNNGNWKDITYGKKMYVLSGEFCMSRTYDLISFIKIQVTGNYISICYSRIYNRFYAISDEQRIHVIGISSLNRDIIISSPDGYNWIPSNNTRFYTTLHSSTPYENKCSSINFDEELSCFYITFSYSSVNHYLAYSKYCNANKNNTLIATKNTIEVFSSIVSISNLTLTGTYPTGFNVFVDSAAKPGTSTWTILSDERLKENIELADLNICYNNVKSLDLKRFKWKDQFLVDTKETDKHRLGWIAQEVEEYIPKAVTSSKLYGLEDCRSLDNDQIIANLYGCVQYLIKKIEEKEAILEARLNSS